MIKVLDKNVAAKIAAGEVIENPISIVKELVENSIDSGATSIIVEIKNGGKTHIRVTDNGSGIEENQAETAFLRHATSKIVCAEDLNTITTLGFRGEALASIAAVTKLEVLTKTKDSKNGIQMIIHGGEIISKKAIGCPGGTSIIINDLFYNTPARMKFMKSEASESSKIIDFVSEIALAFNNVKFRLINNGNILFSTSGDENRLKSIITIYNQNEYKDLVPVDYIIGNTHLSGYVSKTSLSKTTRKGQIFFVNGRIVNSKIMENGINQAYKERLFDGRFPITFLFLQTDPRSLDVNIHPNKRAVRFDNEKSIIDLISNGIGQALGTKEAIPDMNNIFKAKTEKNSPAESQVDIKTLLSNERTVPFVSDIKPQEFNTTEFRENVKITNINTSPLVINSPQIKPFDFNDLTVKDSIFGTYITATDSNNFYLIDQHAAHERIFYEKFVLEYENSFKAKQPILTPIIINVTPSIAETEEFWAEGLLKLGYSIEEFGMNSYIIKEIPTFMGLYEAKIFANTFIENATENATIQNTIIIDKLIMKSCKSAVKAHDYLSPEEVHQLIKDLSNCINPFSCPHGRPTFIKLSNYEIEKMFKRV